MRDLSFRPQRWFLAILLGLSVVMLSASPAAAHADLTSANPTDGALLEVAPSSITLTYTESVTVRPDGVRVIGPDGERVDAGTTTAAGSTVNAPLTTDIGQGTFVVAWRAVSADGHPVRGAYTFSVGQETEVASGAADKAFGSGNDQVFEVLGAVLRGIAYVATMGTAGYVLVAGALRRRKDPPPIGRITTISALVALVSVLFLVVIQGALATGLGVTAITKPGVLSLAVSDGIGLATFVTSVGLLALIITAGLPFELTVRKVASVGAVVAPLGFVIAGHTRSMSPALLGYVADLAHVLAASFWFGGLIGVFAVARWRRRDDDPFGAAEAVARFSGWAAWATGAVLVAGVALAAIEVGGLEALITTTYGRLLMAKVALVLVVIGLAAWNRFRLLPTVAAASVEEPPVDDGRSWSRLLTVVRAETALLLVVLMMTGVLVGVTPAKAAVELGAYSTTAPLAGGSVDITVDPAKAGRNDIHVYLLDANGSPNESFETPLLRLEEPVAGLGPFDREPAKVGPGHYQLVGTELPLAGNWTITVTVKTDRFSEESVIIEFPVR